MMVPALDPTVAKLTVESMSELMTSCALGWGATRVGLLTGPAIRSLASVVFNIFLPSMLLTSVACTVAHGPGLGSLLLIPLAAAVQVGIGLLIGTASVKLLRQERTTPAGRGIAVLSAFGNSGVLPLIFANSLFRGAAQEAQRQAACSLVAMYLLGWSPLFWTVGFALLTGHLVANGKEGEATSAAAGGEAGPASGGRLGAGKESGASGGEADGHRPTTLAPGLEHGLAERLGAHALAARLAAVRAALSRAVSPPIIACVCGLLIGATPPLARLLLPSAAGAPSPLPLYRCLENLGRAYSPAALLVLAGSLAAPCSRERPRRGELGHRFTHVLAVSVARFVLVPICSFGLLQAALHVGLLPPDPLRDFILLLQSCMPSAQNAVLALQVDGEPARAARMARVLLAIYLLAAVPVAGTLSLLLQRYSGGIGLASLL